MNFSKLIPVCLTGMVCFATSVLTTNAQTVTLAPVDTAVTDALDPANVGPTGPTALPNPVDSDLPMLPDFPIRERTNQLTQNSRRISSFLQFDLTEATTASLLANPSSLTAELTLEYTSRLNIQNDAAASVGRVTTAAWDSMDNPPLHSYGFDNGITSAADVSVFIANIAADDPAPTGQTLIIDVTTIVRSWANGEPNHGFVLFINQAESQAAGFSNPQLTISTDSDGDGLPDNYEIANSNPANPLDPTDSTDANNDLDANGGPDGLTNLQEFIAGTDPQDSDTDDDSLNDGLELDGTANPYLTANAGDAADGGPGMPGLPTDPLEPDSDGDGILDGVELLSLTFTPAGGSAISVVTNPNSEDTDGDFLLDNFEASNGLDPTDIDGVNGEFGDPDMDTVDNFNEQLFGIDPNNDDSDGDGLVDGFNDSTTLPGELDTNNSAVPTLVTDPADSDTDGDGLSDDIESNQLSNDNPATIADRDGDTFLDGVEVAAGSDPDDIDSTPTLATINWVPTELTSASDLSTTGTLLFAENLNGPAVTVNGIPFASAIDNSGPRTSSDIIMTGANNNLADPTLYDDEDPALSPILESAWTGGTGGPNGERTVSIFGLTPGLSYEVQVGRADDRSLGDVPIFFITLDGVGAPASSDPVGPTNTAFAGVAQPAVLFTGTFIAAASVQSFEIVENRGAGDNDNLVTTSANFIQVREIEALPQPPEDIAIVDCGFDGATFEITFENLDPSAEYRLVRSANLEDGFPTVVEPSRQPGGAVASFSDPSPDGTENFYRLEEVE